MAYKYLSEMNIHFAGHYYIEGYVTVSSAEKDYDYRDK